MNADAKNIIDNIYTQLKNETFLHVDLMSGKTGILLFNFLYEEYYGNEHSTLESDVQQIAESNVNYNSATFAGGKAGTDWFLNFLHKNKMIDESDLDFFCAKENDLEKVALQMLDKGNYDFLHGALGIAWHLLYSSKKLKESFFRKVFHELNKLAKRSITKNIIPLYDPFLQQIVPQHINLGLSHGITSVLKFCLQCTRQNICIEEATALSKKITHYLISHVNTDKHKSYYPAKIIDEKIMNEHSRLAWCYGDLGIAYMLYQHSIIFMDKKLEEFALEILLHTSKRKIEKDTLVKDACLCHGSSGIAHLYNRLYNFTAENFLKEAGEFWLNKTLAFSKAEDGTEGYSFFSAAENLYEKKSGLLEGLAGIGLAILGFMTNDFSWDNCLMLNK